MKLSRTAPIATMGILSLLLGVTGCSARVSDSAAAECSPGITDTTINLGSSIAMSGPIAAYGEEAKAASAYFQDLNAAGGGIESADGKKRKVTYTAIDDAYDPARTVSNVRSLVENEKVFALVGVLGTSNNLAIADYVNQKKIPNVMAGTGSAKFLTAAKNNPWISSGLPSYPFEGTVWANYVKEKMPNARVGIIYQNDGFGQDIVDAFETAIKGSGVTVVSKQTFEQSATSVDSQVVNLQQAGVDVFMDYANGTFMTQSLKKANELGWKPALTILSPGNNGKNLISPSGAGIADGAVTYHWLKDVSSPDQYKDEGMANWIKFANLHGLNPVSAIPAIGYTNAQTVQSALEKMKGCTRQDFMDAFTSMKDVNPDLNMPGVTVTTSPTYPYTYNSVRLLTWTGEGYKLGDIVTRSKGTDE